ncbi:hypothetical protein L1987_57991 [Smallanthus sonchifolius]|uniref:Uncharacterized protein n=1 Tax=Smallanthus sonchifolius TaxID=185202 RepID=A0ACB9DEP6_9ASTR|nr:hypothetical protein L1987_57991 [Smallanthus sonchifolius]
MVNDVVQIKQRRRRQWWWLELAGRTPRGCDDGVGFSQQRGEEEDRPGQICSSPEKFLSKPSLTPLPFLAGSSTSRRPHRRPSPPTASIVRSSKVVVLIDTTSGCLPIHCFLSLFLMPRKKDPSPSTLPPRRSARGASKSTSLFDGEEDETPVVPLVGLGDNQEGFDGLLQPPPLNSGLNMCHINKESSAIPSVSVSLNESEQNLGVINKDEILKKSTAAGISPAGKTGFAGRSSGLFESDSSGSPGTQGLVTGSGKTPNQVIDTYGFRYADAARSATLLFSPEFKASWGWNYSMIGTGLSPRAPLCGVAPGVHGIGLDPSHTVSEKESVSQGPDVHGHMPGSGLNNEPEVHGIEVQQLGPGVDSEVGLHASVGIDEKATMHEGFDTASSSSVLGEKQVGTPMQPMDRVSGASVEVQIDDDNGREMHVHGFGMGSEGIGVTTKEIKKR